MKLGSRTNQDWQVQTIVWNLSDLRVLFHDSEVINASTVMPTREHEWGWLAHRNRLDRL